MRIFVACCLLSLLCACSRAADHFSPRISITSPVNGIVKSYPVVIAGYVMDDVGITKMTINDQPLPQSGGTEKIARFQYKTDKRDVTKYTIKAYDPSGHVSTSVIQLKLDQKKPSFSIKNFERRGRTIRIIGVATDDTEVTSLTIDGRPVVISPARRVEFQAETTGVYADLAVYDAAGNKATLRLQR